MFGLSLGFSSCETIVIPLWLLCVNFVNACELPKASGFYGCGADTGKASGLLGTFSVSSMSACVRRCTDNSLCTAVAVQTGSPPRSCELFSEAERCDEVGARPGYQYFIQIRPFHKCFVQSAVVKGVMRTGDNSYVLFFDATRQEFVLEKGVLEATGCPLPNEPYFLSWPTDTIKAMFRSDVLGDGKRFYVIHGTLVQEYYLQETMAFPSMVPPWPITISDLFGPELPDSIRAVVEKENRLHVTAADGVYVYRARGPFEDFGFSLVETLPPVSALSEFLNDITAAVYTSSPDIRLIFTGKSYILYNEAEDSVVGQGLVCSNKY